MSLIWHKIIIIKFHINLGMLRLLIETAQITTYCLAFNMRLIVIVTMVLQSFSSSTSKISKLKNTNSQY